MSVILFKGKPWFALYQLSDLGRKMKRKSAPPIREAIPYYRVSTERQGQSGLGLEAQKRAVQDCARFRNLKLVGEFIEVESGDRDDRPMLQKALAVCRKRKAILLIAKLSRLARNVYFISQLLRSGVDFRSADNFDAGKLIVHVTAAFDEYEREQISERTKAALQSAKRRGVELGKNGKYVLSKQNRRKANGFARKMKPIISALRRQGFSTIRQLTDEMNERNITPYSGSSAKWHTTSVFNLLKRIKAL